MNNSSTVEIVTRRARKLADQHLLIVRREFDGPVLADLAEGSTPAVARMDVGWAASVVAGYAYDAAELVSLLCVLGIMTASRWKSDKERRAEVAKEYGRLGNKRKVAKWLRLRYDTVDYDLSLWQREHPGQPFPGRAATRRADRMEQAVRLRAEGLTLREIAARLFCHYTTIRNDLLRWDQSNAMMLNPPPRPSAARRDVLKTRVEKRLPGDQIQQPDSTGEVIPLRRNPGGVR